MQPFTSDGRFLQRFAYDTVSASLTGKLVAGSSVNPSMSIFNRKYDLICPLPSSKGPASLSNMQVAQVIASAFNDHGHFISSPIKLVPMVERFKPMKCKSTAEDRNVRRSKDAARIMHYDNMQLHPEFAKDVAGQSILLYDDVFTWGNTSEAARNLLLMAGAVEVDLITCFSTGDIFRSSIYEKISEESSSESFKLVKSTLTEKIPLEWEQQKSLKEWHSHLKDFIKQHFPEFVPNDIPWL